MSTGGTLVSDGASERVSTHSRDEPWWIDETLAEFGSSLLSSLQRSDQRSKGIDYLRGLLGVPGRKSIRNIAALFGGSATEQKLHHFICDSTWDWEPVRQALARHVMSSAPPLAWVVQPMVIPKAGENSVGVDRQYLPEVGKVINAQRAVGVWATNERVSCPVNWRIFLSEAWLNDGIRRRQAAIPGDLMPQTMGDTVMDACLETAGGWGLPVRPVVLDARNMDIPVTVRRFRAAGVPFLMRISPTAPFAAPDNIRFGRGFSVKPANQIMAAERDAVRPVVWREHHDDGATLRSSVGTVCRVHVPGRSRRIAGGFELHLVGVGEDRRRWPGELWLTDMLDAALPALVGWSKLTSRTERDLCETTDRVGIRDFTGRSYGGWHRHVTLASAAHHAVSTLGAAVAAAPARLAKEI
jgi:hypothetical protein